MKNDFERRVKAKKRRGVFGDFDITLKIGIS
jgi:hypothetical protein